LSGKQRPARSTRGLEDSRIRSCLAIAPGHRERRLAQFGADRSGHSMPGWAVLAGTPAGRAGQERLGRAE
jgi:hypothetical protein